jgi:phthalate 4,5-cis-dihydrodiol dehydrogenase
MADAPILRLGFLGLGQAVNIMLTRKHDIAALPFRIAAAADPRESARAMFKREFNGEAFATAEELCKSPAVDVVYVATPPEMHRAHVELAATHGKHIVVEKPMALSLADCDAMVEAVERADVKLVAGHTHSFDAPVRKMREIISSGEIGNLVMLNTWNFNEFNPRPWPSAELVTTHGPILNQAPHQIDIVRQLGGGLVRSVRAQTIWDSLRRCEGGWICFLEFDNGVPASLVFDARGFFDTAELHWWVGESGAPRDPNTNATMRCNFRALAARGADELERVLEAQKEVGRYGADIVDLESLKLWGYGTPQTIKHSPFFGLTLASCERGAIRQSADGLLIYGEDGVTEVSLERAMRGRAAELMDLYNGVVHGKPILHDGRWGQATLEVCLAILESATSRREISLSHQVPMSA